MKSRLLLQQLLFINVMFLGPWVPFLLTEKQVGFFWGGGEGEGLEDWAL